MEHKWLEIYEYYFNKGLTKFIINGISSLCIGVFVSFSPILLFGCLDLNKISSAKSFGDMVLPLSKGWSRINFFLKICSILFFFFNIVQLYHFIKGLMKFVPLHIYFKNTLNITDHELIVMEWTEVIQNVQKFDSMLNVTILSIAQEILKYDNYMCALVSDSSLLTWTLPFNDSATHFPMSRFFFFFMKSALSGIVFDNNGSSLITHEQTTQTVLIPKKVDQLNRRFWMLGIVLGVLSPFVFAFQIMYLLFHYIEVAQHSFESISMRRWSPQAKWTIREYNELPHIFNSRIGQSYAYANAYLDQFPSAVVQPLLRTATFISGAIISLLVVFGILSDTDQFLSLSLFNHKSVAWFLSLLIVIYILSKSLIIPETVTFDPDSTLRDVERYIHYDFRDSSNSGHAWQAQKNFSNFFQPIVKQILLELISPFLNPFIFGVVLPVKAQSIVEFVRRNTYVHPELGAICSFSIFEAENRGLSPDQKIKVYRSIQNFDDMGELQINRHDSLISFNNDSDGILSDETLPPAAPAVLNPNNHNTSNDALNELDQEMFINMENISSPSLTRIDPESLLVADPI